MGEFAKTNYNNAITRDNLLSMLYPRLQLAKELLSDDGVIFCSIDDRNQAYVKCLFDEVFREDNFVANIVWNCKNKPSGNTTENKGIDTRTEYILCYCKNELNINKYENTKEELLEKGYILEDEYLESRGRYKLTPLMRSCSASSFQYLESLDYEIQAPDGTFFKNHQNIKKPKSYGYTWSKKLFDFGNANGFIEIKKTSDGYWCAYRKMYEYCGIDNKKLEIIYRNSGNAYHNLITGIYSDSGANEVRNIMDEKVFANPKPIGLIKHLLKISTSAGDNNMDSESDIILDFFAGSGTTGHATLELNREDGGNRQFILVTNNETTDINPNGIAIDVTSKRLKRIMSGQCYDGNTSFKWLEKNKPYGGSLEVSRIESVSNKEQGEGKSAFEVIDERLYGLEPFKDINDKIKWVCENFEITQKEEKDSKILR